MSATWDVEYTDEFGQWWAGLTVAEQESVAASVRLLEERQHRYQWFEARAK